MFGGFVDNLNAGCGSACPVTDATVESTLFNKAVPELFRTVISQALKTW